MNSITLLEGKNFKITKDDTLTNKQYNVFINCVSYGKRIKLMHICSESSIDNAIESLAQYVCCTYVNDSKETKELIKQDHISQLKDNDFESFDNYIGLCLPETIVVDKTYNIKQLKEIAEKYKIDYLKGYKSNMKKSELIDFINNSKSIIK